MRNFIDKILQSVAEFFAKLGKKEKIRLGVLAVVIVALAITVSLILGRTTYGVLFSDDMDAATAGDIIAELNSMGVPYRTQGAGTILIPEESISEVRMQLAAQGYMSKGFSNDIFEQARGFGSTDLERRSYLLFLDEYKVRQQLLTMSKIKDCLVKINLPEPSSFVIPRDPGKASAAVTIELISGESLTENEVEGLTYIVSAGTSVPVENIIIMDTNGFLYTFDDEAPGLASADFITYQIELENEVRRRLESQVVNLLSSVFGNGKVKASVAVALDFDRETVHSVEFAPPVEGETEGLVISMSEVYELTREAGVGGIVGTDTNGIGTVQYPIDFRETDAYQYFARDFNYEINETVRQIEKAQASIKSLSIAVLVDSETIEEDYTSNVRNLVINAIGVNEKAVSVERLPFRSDSLESATTELENIMRDMKNAETLQLIIKGVIILLLVIAILLFLRTLLRALRPAPVLIPAEAGIGGFGDMGEGIDYLIDEEADLTEEAEIDISAKSEGMEQLEKFIEKDSKAVAQLLRNWLIDEE